MTQYATKPKVNSYIPGKFDHISSLSTLGTDSYPLCVERQNGSKQNLGALRHIYFQVGFTGFLDSRQNSNEVNVFGLNVFLCIVHATNIRRERTLGGKKQNMFQPPKQTTYTYTPERNRYSPTSSGEGGWILTRQSIYVNKQLQLLDLRFPDPDVRSLGVFEAFLFFVQQLSTTAHTYSFVDSCHICSRQKIADSFQHVLTISSFPTL